MPSFLAYRLGLMSHLGSTFSKNDVRDNPKIIKTGPKQVAMAPFGSFPAPSEAHRPQDASGMPPGPHKSQKIRIWGSGGPCLVKGGPPDLGVWRALFS